MKKFIKKISIFIAILLIVDLAIGYIFSHLFLNARGGDTARSVYICDKSEEDILIFGSSRAIHHYNPVLISDSLGMKCYNCGQNGNGIILNYGRLHMVLERYNPKMIVYDIGVGFDLECNNNTKYLGKLKPYYRRDGISMIFDEIDKNEKWKMMSSMYTYNSMFIQIISDIIHPLESDIKGFRPLEGDMDTMKIIRGNDINKPIAFDPVKISFFRKMFEEAKDSKLILVVSPMWYGLDSEKLTPIKQLCEQYNVPLIDFSNNPKYVSNNNYFKDGSHLNARGADEFTCELIPYLKNYIQ